MRFLIKHEIRGRVRLHVKQHRMTYEQADTLEWYLSSLSQVKKAVVYEATCDVVIRYEGSLRKLLTAAAAFDYEKNKAPEDVTAHSGRQSAAEFKDKLITMTAARVLRRAVLPAPVREVITAVKAVPFLVKGVQAILHGKLEVAVLDAAAIGVSIVRGDYSTADSVIYLLSIGELLEDWTRKKSRDDLARVLALPAEKVWMIADGQEVLTEREKVAAGDHVVVHMGSVIPFDGTVVSGTGMANQASMTGEALAVRKEAGDSVFAGTVLEEGEITIAVRNTSGESRYENITRLIEESEKMKSSVESRAEHLADRLVPYCFAGTALTYLLSGNAMRALSVLMVDYSCALKLAMPVAVISAMRTAAEQHITVKGGRFMEELAQADTIVFDKTGTLTKANPRVAQVVPFDGEDESVMLMIAACMEEHFPHSMAKAVVEAAEERSILHDEMHTKVNYLVAHGIATTIDGKRACIGSRHFIFEDEGAVIPESEQEKFAALPDSFSHLYLSIDGRLKAVICIEDPVRQEAASVISDLRDAGFTNIVMMTGDNKHIAERIAGITGVDRFYAEVLPEDKAGFVEQERAAGHTVVMVGDGINDSPALSAADVGIAISDGAEIAREIADITVSGGDISDIVIARRISASLIKRINFNYRFIVSFNTALIVLGVLGIISPTTSALLHNGSTLAIGLKSLTNVEY